MRPTVEQARGFGGHIIDFLGCGEAEVQMGNQVFTLTFHVVANQIHRVLIGFNAFWHMGLVSFSIRKGTMSINGETLHLHAKLDDLESTNMIHNEEDQHLNSETHDSGPQEPDYEQDNHNLHYNEWSGYRQCRPIIECIRVHTDALLPFRATPNTAVLGINCSEQGRPPGHCQTTNDSDTEMKIELPGRDVAAFQFNDNYH
jgi:hypothetical protein